MSNSEELELLIDAFHSLPGIGKKNAKKMAYFMINQDHRYIYEFTKRITNAKQKLKTCPICNNITNQKICNICSSINRDNKSICIVNNIEDLDCIETSGAYNGLYFVLGIESNRKTEWLDIIDISINELIQRFDLNNHISQIIIATNYNYSGELIAQRILTKLSKYKIKIYRIGFGLPLNSSLDYADSETLKQSFLNKRNLK